MRITEWFSPPKPCKAFDTHERLFDGLRKLDNAAILCIQTKVLNSVRKLVGQYRLPAELADDILNQSTLIFLQKIESGAYQFQNHAPTTYLIEIAKRLALMATRSNKKNTESIDNQLFVADPDFEINEKQRESAELVRHFMGQMGPPCDTVIRLHHLDGYSDEEVIRLQLTPYSTIASLKMKRSDCMKKLIQLALQWKISNNI